MDTTVQVAIVGSASALITGVVTYYLAPHINWRIEQKKQLLEQRRRLVSEWRDLVRRLNTYNDRFPRDGEQEYLSPKDWLQRDKVFYSLKPHLSEEAIEGLNSMHVPGVTDILVDEVARIEKVWKLV